MTATATLIRQTVRDLIRGKTDAGDRISINRSEQIWRNEIPCIVIYSRSGTFKRMSETSQIFARTAKIDVELVVEQVSDDDGNPLPVDDLADEMKMDVLNELLADKILRNIVENLNSFEPQEEAEKTESNTMRDVTSSGVARQLCAIVLTFEASWDEEYKPDEANLLDDFRTADVKINTPQAGADLGAATEELVTFPRP